MYDQKYTKLYNNLVKDPFGYRKHDGTRLSPLNCVWTQPERLFYLEENFDIVLKNLKTLYLIVGAV